MMQSAAAADPQTAPYNYAFQWKNMINWMSTPAGPIMITATYTNLVLIDNHEVDAEDVD